MAIPESGFINNVNLVASKLSTIEEAAILFDTATVEILNQIASLDIEAIVEDLKKSNYLGNRKLDINLALNNLSTSTQVAYSQANLVLKNGTTLAVPFQIQLPNSTWVTEELTSHADIKNYIQNSSQFINSVINTELTVEDELGLSPQLIRFRDADGTSSNLDRVELIAYSGSYVDGTVQYTWADTTSSLQTLANRATDILVLGQSIDAIVVLSTMPTQIDSLHTNMATLTALYTDLTEIMTVYSNLQAVLAVVNSIGSVNTVSINIADILSVNTNIVPNLAEILQADSNAVAAALSQTQAAGSAANASISAGNAATSASTALGYLNQFSTLVAQANTLVAGSNASASYNSSTGVLSLGIPQGIKGDKGDALSVSAFGTFATRSTYDGQALGFSFLAVDTSTLYFKASNTSGDWSSGVSFGKGDTGDAGVQGYSWLTGSGVPSGGLGVNGDLYLNQANADVYNKVGGSWGIPITNLAASINDATTSSALAWSSTKISTELGLKSDTTHAHAGVYEPANANLQSHLTTTTNPHAVTKAQVGLGNVDNTSNATERTATATLTNKTIVATNNTITTAVSGNLTSTELNAALAELQTDIDTRVATSSKDASNGVVGMTLFKINFKNLANTFTSQMSNSNTAARTYTFQDRNGTIADHNDLASKADKASPTFTGTVTLPTATVAITKAPGTSSTELATTAFVAGEVDAHEAVAIDVHDASAISNIPSVNLSATNVQAALNELAGDVLQRVLKTSDTGSAQLPASTTANRDGTPQAGYLRFNTTLNQFEGYNGTAWGAVGGVSDGDKGEITVSGSGGTWTIADGVVTPAKLTAAAKTSKIQPITASVSSNALTITLNPTVLDFRSSSLTSGSVNARAINSAISTVISSGSTGGTVNGVQSRIVVLAIDNAGTVVLGWTNIAGGLKLDETNLITTTAEGGAGGADSANVIYTTVAVTTPSPYRVVGYVESTQATAGSWSSSPTTIQGYGGQALSAMSSLGYGQTLQNLTGSRALSTNYYNTTGKPIVVYISGSSSSSFNWNYNINGIAFAACGVPSGSIALGFNFIVAPGFSYNVSYAGAGSLATWCELR